MSTNLQAAPAVEAVIGEAVISGGVASAAELRDAAYRRELSRAKHHRLMLWLAAMIVGGTFLLEVRDDQRVTLRGVPSVVLPESCAGKVVFGYECPGCGLTRSFIWAGRGEWLRSLEMNRVGFLMMLAVVGQIPYRLAMLGRFRRGEPTTLRWPARIGWFLIAALFINWGLKLFGI